jgi:exonuclease III
MFYVELSSLLDDLATLAERVFVAGDFNIRLDQPDLTTPTLGDYLKCLKHMVSPAVLAVLHMIALEHST